MKSVYGDRLDIILKQEDYILSQADDFNHDIFEAREAKKWDIVISNPPYMKNPLFVTLLFYHKRISNVNLILS